jgi:hypothetical protein
MTPRPRSANPKTAILNVRVEPWLFEELQAIQERDGVPLAEQVRRGALMWLESKGVIQKSERKRAGTRKRS